MLWYERKEVGECPDQKYGVKVVKVELWCGNGNIKTKTWRQR